MTTHEKLIHTPVLAKMFYETQNVWLPGVCLNDLHNIILKKMEDVNMP